MNAVDRAKNLTKTQKALLVGIAAERKGERCWYDFGVDQGRYGRAKPKFFWHAYVGDVRFRRSTVEACRDLVECKNRYMTLTPFGQQVAALLTA